MTMLQRRRCVEPPNHTVNRLDLNYEVSDLHDRLRHALHFIGETIPLSQNTFMFGARTTICFERLQGLDPLGKLPSGFVQTIPRENRVLHPATRKFQGVA
jgi:hypothetical protein